MKDEEEESVGSFDQRKAPTPASSAGKKFTRNKFIIINTSSILSETVKLGLQPHQSHSLLISFYIIANFYRNLMFLRRTAILSRGYRSLVLASNRPSVFIGSTALSFPTRNPSPLTGILSRSYAVTNPVMADNASTSGVTADGLKEKLTAQLEAQFVEIEDMSGKCVFDKTEPKQ